METHVKVLGALQIALGCLSLLAAVILTVVFMGGVGAMGMSGDPDAQRAMPFVGLIGTSIVTLLVVTSLPSIFTGIGLLKFRPWARSVGTVVAIIEILSFPLGTILACYSLWVLMSAETDALFSPRFGPR